MSSGMHMPPTRVCRWTTTMDGSRLRFVTMVPERATGVRQIPEEAMASPGCGSVPKPLVAACPQVRPSDGGFLVTASLPVGSDRPR